MVGEPQAAKAVAVVQALKNTARVKLDCKKLCSPARHAIT